MDERDFAELISVFLKGAGPDNTPDSNEPGAHATDNPQQAPSDAELRKNIIEALAEKIKESQEVEEVALQETPDDEALQETVMFDDTRANADEEALPVVDIDEQLVTKEEVDKLLNKDEPANIMPLQQILHRFLDLDGVIAAMLITRDGFTVDYASNIEFEFDMVSAVAATGFAVFGKIGDELGKGVLDIAMLEYDAGPVIISPVVHDVALVVVASQWATLGRIRWEIKKQANDLITHL
ncbi:MAG TPA: roadblock/LC7 domain-containing protein [Candidatus Aquicultor sp.]